MTAGKSTREPWAMCMPKWTALRMVWAAFAEASALLGAARRRRANRLARVPRDRRRLRVRGGGAEEGAHRVFELLRAAAAANEGAQERCEGLLHVGTRGVSRAARHGRRK